MFEPKLTVSDLDTLNFEKYEAVVRDLAKLDEDQLTTELSTFPSEYSYYYGLAVAAKYRSGRATARYEEARSKYLSEQRSSRTKLTVAAGEDLVNSNEDLVNHRKVVDEKELIYSYLKGICNTLDHKKDMLVQLSSNKRQETKLYQ